MLGDGGTWWEMLLGSAMRADSYSFVSAFLRTVRYAEWWNVALVVTGVVMASAKLWGFGGGVILTRCLKQPLEKIGIEYDALKFSLLRSNLKLTDVELLPHKSDTVRGILLSIYPSADVVSIPSSDKGAGEDVEVTGKTTLNSTSFPGSRVRIASIGLRFSLRLAWFEPGSYLVDLLSPKRDSELKAKRQDGADDDAANRSSLGDQNEELDNAFGETFRRLKAQEASSSQRVRAGGGLMGATDAEVEAMEAALPEVLRPWYRRLAVFGVVPVISLEVHGLRIEVDKAYLAPPPPPGIDVPSPPRRRHPRSISGLYWGGKSQRGSILSASEQSVGDASSEFSVLPPAALVPTSQEDTWDEFDNISEEEFQLMRSLPHFDQETFLRNMEGSGSGNANSITFFIEKWLEHNKGIDQHEKSATTKKMQKSSGEDVQQGAGILDAGAPTDDGGTSSASVSGGGKDSGDDDEAAIDAGEEKQKRAGSAGADSQENDRMKSLFHTLFRSLLSSVSIVAHDTQFIVTGADGDTVKRTRAESQSPRLASVALARVPQEERATVMISASCLSLKCQGQEYDTILDMQNLAVTVRHPVKQPAHSSRIDVKMPSTFRRRTEGAPSEQTESKERAGAQGAPRDEASDFHELVPPHDASLELNGLLPILIWSVNYDHRWEYRRLGMSLTIPDTTVCVSPWALHTFMALMDDFVDPNSPFSEWNAWLSKARLESVRLDDEERQLYRECYVKSRLKKKKEGKGKKEEIVEEGGKRDDANASNSIQSVPISLDEDKSNSLQSTKSISTDEGEATLLSLEKRMTGDEIIVQRCLAMKDTWLVDSSNGELVAFLRSTESRIVQTNASVSTVGIPSEKSSDQGEDQENSGALPFRKTFASPLEALVVLVKEKFHFLAPGFSFSLDVASFSVQLSDDLHQQDVAVGVGLQHFSSSIGTMLHLESVEMCLGMKSPIFSPVVLKQPGQTGLQDSAFAEPSQSPAGTTSEMRQTLRLTLAVHSAIFTPVDTGYDTDLPCFLDGSLLGIMYDLQSKTPRPMLHLSLQNCVSLDQTFFTEIKGNIDNVAVVFNPVPLCSALDVLSSASETPARDIEYERQLYSLSQIERKTNGTLFNGAHLIISLDTSNLSLVLLSDSTNLHKGCLDLNASGVSVLLHSEKSTERLKFSASSFCSFTSRLYGSSDNGVLFINRLPFKQPLSISELDLHYIGESIKKHGSSSGKEAVCEIDMNLCLTIGKIMGYSSPGINVTVLACLESLNRAQELLSGDKKEDNKKTKEEELRIETELNREKYMLRQEALVELWKEADADGSNSLDRAEVEQIILRIFHSTSDSTSMFLGNIPQALRVTNDELQREVRHFLSLCDPHHDNDISFQEVDAILYRDDDDTIGSMPSPKSREEHAIRAVDRLNELHFSYRRLRGLLYYDDLREFTSTRELYRITGKQDPRKFPPPSLWKEGGIALFWEFYQQETGCTQTSLNGQDILTVQQKLVRALLNYEFAKFCWKSLIGPSLREAEVSGKVGTKRRPRSTDWLVDNDTKATAVTKGVIDHLVQHIEQRTSDMQHERKVEASSKGAEITTKYMYKVCVELKVDCLLFAIGNGLTFARPLVAVEAGPLSFEGSSLVQPPSQGSLFVSSLTESTPEPAQEPSAVGAIRQGSNGDKSGGDNDANFQLLRIRVKYLNMTHDTEETLVEPFRIYGFMSYSIVKIVSATNDEEEEAATAMLEMYIPKFINMNISPSFLETSTLVKVITGDTSRSAYEELFIQRHFENVREAWHNVGKDFDQDLTLEDIQELFADAMKSSKEKITEALGEDIGSVFMKYVDFDGNGTVSWAEIEKVVASHTLVFNPVSTRVHNRTGNAFHCSTQSELEGILKTRSASLISEVTAGMTCLPDDKCRPLQLYSVSSENELVTDKLVIMVPNCKILDGIPLTSYQSQMFHLRPLKRGLQNRRRGARRKKHQYGTGFEPYLTVVAASDKIDAITYTIRSSIVVKANTPVDVRVVCLPSALPFLRRQRGNKSRDGSARIDLSKKNFALLLEKTVDNCPVVFERLGVSQGSDVALPVDIFLSHSIHALLLRDLTGEGDSHWWRKPILLTKDFLLNTKHLPEVVRCHDMSGITVAPIRLNVHNSKRHKRSARGDVNKNSGKTAWDVTIQVHPSFALLNSLPFPIQFHSWQDPKATDEWTVPVIDVAEATSLGDDDQLEDSLSHRKREHLKKHTNGDTRSGTFGVADQLPAGGTVRLNGMDMSEVLYLQVSQDCASWQGDLSKLIWSSPISIDLGRLKTGGKKSGSLSLPTIQGRLGDLCDIQLSVIVERDGTPFCTLFSPYWITNKTGMKLLYKVTGNDMIYDSGVGGMPILTSCKVGDTSSVGVAKREIAIMPLEGPKADVATVWWDDATNGKLVLEHISLKHNGKKRVEWSGEIGLDQAGSFGEIKCRNILFGVAIESLTGVFHKSNLISLSVRYVVKNTLQIPVTVIPMQGLYADVKKTADRLREEGIDKAFSSKKHSPPGSTKHPPPIHLDPSETTILYEFQNVSHGFIKDNDIIRFLCVRVEMDRWNKKAKWHLILVDNFGATHYTEYDGLDNRMSGMFKVDVKQQQATTVISIGDTTHPPFLIENRSATHYLQFVQDDPDGVVNEVPPLNFCGYSWCNPQGKKRLRFVSLEKARSKEFLVEQAYGVGPEAGIKQTHLDSVHSEVISEGEVVENENAGSTADYQTTSVDQKSSGEHAEKHVSELSILRSNSHSGDPFVKRKRLFTKHSSRSYNLAVVGRHIPLPCTAPSGTSISELITEVHVIAGTRTMTFSDSDWRLRQIKDGLLRIGGHWKNTQFLFLMEGLAAHLTDDFPREVMSVLIRQLTIVKPKGFIEVSAKLRHFQVDAMFKSPKYPVMLRPVPMGVDRRQSSVEEVGLSDSSDIFLGGERVLEIKDQFWRLHNEQPFPVVEAMIAYLPQPRMTWIPQLKVVVCPMKMQIELDFCLRLADLIIDSLPEADESETDRCTLNTLSGVEKPLRYESHSNFGSELTYVENLSIEATWFELDLDIRPKDEASGDEDGEGDTMLALSSLGRTTKSQLSASVLSWLGNVASAFARVSPTFKFGTLTRRDTIGNGEEIADEIKQYYITKSIYQSYKVLFSMHVLGSPSHLIHQYKEGTVALFTKTTDEIMTGGQDGYGKGVESFVENVFGGTFTALGTFTGSLADVLDSATTTEYTSKKMKPKAPTAVDAPSNIVEGFTHGTIFMGKAVIHGVVGVVGNPYRGITEGQSAKAFGKGLASGVGGLVVAPFVGALGFIAKVTAGTGEMAKISVDVIDARCRPLRVVRWGSSIGTILLPYMKAIGIRIHSVRYQKKYKGLQSNPKDTKFDTERADYPKNAKEFKKAKADDERRRMPQRKVISAMRQRDKKHHLTAAARPMLLLNDVEASRQQKVSKYLVVFEETIIMRREDLQLSDAVTISLWQNKTLKPTTTKAKPLAQCRMTVGDMHIAMEKYHQEKIRQYETQIMQKAKAVSRSTQNKREEVESPNMLGFLGIGKENAKRNVSSESEGQENMTLSAPAIQEFALMRPVPKRSRPKHSNLSQAIQEEMTKLRKEEKEALRFLESDDSDESSSDSSFMGNDQQGGSDDDSDQPAAMEQLYGHVSVSFFPISW